jgi:hypothetical protein
MQTQNDITVQQVNFTCNTDGQGWWSDVAKAVAITQLVLCLDEEDMQDADYADLHVYFSDDSWNVDTDGLIYSDMLFKQQLIKHLTALGLDASEVSYSEQGMQGDKFVSLDVDDKFIASWNALYNA